MGLKIQCWHRTQDLNMNIAKTLISDGTVKNRNKREAGERNLKMTWDLGLQLSFWL
ncbi:hypothetical protein V6Z12_D02G206300 [Gossypium hirsutum]